MIPEGFATLLAFLGLIAPGLVHQLVLEKRQPQLNDSNFREASRVALTSLVFTGISLLTLAAIEQLFAPSMWLIDVRGIVDTGWTYLAEHLLLVSTTLAAIVIVSCLLAAAAAWWLTRKAQSSLTPYGAWYQIFRKDRPTGYRVWVHLRLVNGSEFWGHLRHYTEDDTSTVSEIVLGGEELWWREEVTGPIELIGNKWDAVCANAEDIKYLRIAYQDLNDELFGRMTADDLKGRRLLPVLKTKPADHSVKPAG